MFFNSLKKITINRNMSELLQNVRKNIILTLVYLLFLLCEFFTGAKDKNNFWDVWESNVVERIELAGNSVKYMASAVNGIDLKGTTR